MSDGGAEDGADGKAGDSCPDEIDREPAPPERAELVMSEQAEAEHDEREGGAVVETGFAGETEAKSVPVFGIGHLHVRGEHRIGGGEDRAEEDRGAEREVER